MKFYLTCVTMSVIDEKAEQYKKLGFIINECGWIENKYNDITKKNNDQDCPIIEVESLEQLKKLSEELEEQLILDFKSEIPVITIYDDYME